MRFYRFLNFKLLTALFLGFSSGIPLALTAATLQAWMSTENVDLTVIGLFSFVGIPYTAKFAWSPIFDRYTAPIFSQRLGNRKAWLLLTQIALFIFIVLLGWQSPKNNPGLLVIVAMAVAFFSASQDIVIDAYRTEIFTSEERGISAGFYTSGYRLAMITSGAIALILSDHLSWAQVYFMMGACLLIGIVVSIFGIKPIEAKSSPKTLLEAYVEPLGEFIRRPSSIEVLVFIIIYRLDVNITQALMTPFLLETGFTKTEIGTVSKVFGVIATIAGVLVGGTLMTKMNLKKSLWTFGVAQGISGITFVILAHYGHNYALLVLAIAFENFFSGMGTAAYSALLMSLCNLRFTATQYALLSSLMAATRVVLTSPSGFMAKAMGWEWYFIVATLLMIPGLILLTRYDRWTIPGEQK